LTLTIVGRYMELDNDGKTATTSIETLREQIDPGFEPDSYGLMLTNDVDADELKAALVRDSGEQFEVLIVEAGTFAEDVNQVRILLGVLAAALMLLGLGNLLTTALLGVRERMRDVAVLKAIGCTPRQVIGSVVVGIGVLAIISLVIGIPLGLLTTRVLLDYAGEGAGFGSEFGRMPPWTWIAALTPVALLLAILAGTLPAQRAANMRVTEALRAE
ncbi:MAG: FtsX-like permease family protein, partial [Thermomicrobiales bacterium]|nr:FtsX-like permease family protein [Thermomicrobiales bacterium]